MTSDPYDLIYIDDGRARPARPDRQRTRRQITIADGDWHRVGDPAAAGGVEGKLQAEVFINKVELIVELQLSELTGHEVGSSPTGSGQRRRALPTMRVRGGSYSVVAVYAAQE